MSNRLSKKIQLFASTLLRRALASLCLTLLLLLVTFSTTWAWPNDGDWHAIYRGFDQLGDPQNDAIGNDARDIVGDADESASYIYSDGNFIHFRIRVDVDPRADITSGTFGPFGWGLLVDTNMNLDDYEYMIMLDGISGPEVMFLARNTVQGIIGDPSDKAEVIIWQENLNYNNNYRVLGPTDSGGPTSNFGGDGDFFVDWFIPFDIFKNSLGLDDNSVIRYFVGSANNAMVLVADLVAGSTANSAADISDGASNYMLPSGVQPTTGGVYFVSNADGSGDLTEFFAGSTVYLKVLDDDRNTLNSTIETITVQVSSPTGDLEPTITLTETGPDTGIFVGPLPTADSSESDNDGTLQTSPIEVITVTYNDAADSTSPIPLTDQPRTDTCIVKPAADIAVTQSVDNATPNEGDTITYTITITNNGPSAASGIQVNDSLPPGITYTGHTAPAGTLYNPSSGLWVAGDLATGDNKSLQISATINPGTAGQPPINNTATKTTAAQIDPVVANNSATVGISVTGADLRVSKTVDNASPANGSTVNFTITVTNDGTYDATNVELTDILPIASWSAVNVTSIDQGSWSYVGDNFVWTIGTIPYTAPIQSTVTLVIAATLDASVTNGTTVINTASITNVDQKDPHSSNDSDSAQLVVGGMDLSVSKVVTTPASATPDVGDTVTFTVTVTNDASASTTATGIRITDTLPNGLRYLSASSSQGTYASGSGIWNVGSLTPGASATLTLNTTVNSSTAGQTLINKVSITDYNEPDIDTGNHTASAAVNVRATDLLIEKTVADPTPTTNSGQAVYTLTVTNLGSIAASGVSIFDQLPGQVTYVSDSPSEGTYSTTTHLWDGITLAAATGDPAQTDNKATLTITTTYSLGNNDPKTFFNTAALSASVPSDNNSANNTATATVSIDGTDLGITKVMNTGFNNYPASGATTEFLITVTNYGPSTANDIVIEDFLPNDFSCDAGTVSTGSFANNGSNCKWTISSLTSGSSATWVLTSTVSAPDGTIANNQVSITEADQPDPASGNNAANQLVYVGGSDLSLEKTIDNINPNEGDIVKFTITLTNNGTNNVSGIEVTDQFPAGMTLFTSGPNAPLPSQGTYDSATGIWDVGTVDYTVSPLETATLELFASVDANTSGTTITNQATITAANSLDPDSSNNLASQSVNIQQADVYINKSANTLTPFVSDHVIFTITAGNNGPDTATGLVVNDLLPAGLTYVSHDPPGAAYNSTSGVWTVGSVAKGLPTTLMITAQVTGSHDVNITNTAAKSSVDQYDPNTTNDSQSVELTTDAIDLRITKSVNTPSPEEGSDVVFTLTVYNQDTLRTATSVQVTDQILAANGFSYVSDTAAASTTAYDSATGVWDIGTLGPMSNVSMTLTATIGAGTGGTTITNSASISSNDQFDNDLTNNSVSVDITPASPASLTIVKMANTATAQPGDTITYTLIVTNTGQGAADTVVLEDHMSPFTSWSLDSYGVGLPFQLQDSSPASGLTLGTPTYSSDHGSTWVYAPTSTGGGAPVAHDGNVTNWKIPMNGTLRANGSITLRYRVQVK